MTDRQTYLVGAVALVVTGVILYKVRVNRYGKKEKTLPKPQSQPTTTVKMPANTLAGITINQPTRTYLIKDRQKFLDDWAAEEGGVESIREMYSKRPDKFSAAEVSYLKSKGILPKTELEKLIGRGL